MMEDCKDCKQTRENCECHIPFEEKHKELIAMCEDLRADKPACYKSCSDNNPSNMMRDEYCSNDLILQKAVTRGCVSILIAVGFIIVVAMLLFAFC